MQRDPELIIQVPHGSALERRLHESPPSILAGRDVLVQAAPTDPEGVVEAMLGGEVVLSMPAPEGLAREADQVRRVLTQSGTGAAPLLIVIDAAEELRDEQLAPVLDGAPYSRPVILRIIRALSEGNQA
jgi:hypothetical protein